MVLSGLPAIATHECKVQSSIGRPDDAILISCHMYCSTYYTKKGFFFAGMRACPSQDDLVRQINDLTYQQKVRIEVVDDHPTGGVSDASYNWAINEQKYEMAVS